MTEQSNTNITPNTNITTNTKTKSKQTLTTKNIVITGMFTAILCVLAQISIPTLPIPFTLSLYAIFLIGALLPPRLALMSVLAYILLGTFGLPVFAGFKGGVQTLTGVTGGFIMAYPIMALVTSLSYQITRKAKPVLLITGMLVSLLVCYSIGSLWFSHFTDTSFYYALTVCVFPFIIFDLIKIGLAAFTGLLIRNILFKSFMDF